MPIRAGDCEIIPVHDLPLVFPIAMMFPALKEDDIAPYRELYPEMFAPAGLALDCGAYLIRTREATVVVDTGFGPGPIAMLGGAKGNLGPDIAARGVPLESVDVVVHTHLHIDHVGWNLTDGKPTFPKARYYAPQADFEAFSANPAVNPQMNQVLPLQEMGKLELYSGAVQLTPEVRTLPSPGHTPGHHSVLVQSGGESVLMLGDVAHHPMQVDRTEWSSSFDMDPARAAQTRERLMSELESEGGLAAFGHFRGDGVGRIVRSEGRRVFQAL